jgi:hypothetical protein
MLSGRRIGWLVLAAMLGLVPAVLWAAKPAGPSQAAPERVELFAAMKQGQIDVKVIPKDSTQVRVLIENKTTRPLSVQLPEAFAAVPVLAQRAGGRGGRGGRSGRNSGTSGGNQAMGGGMMGGMGGGMGGGFGGFNIAPEQVGQLRAPAVCLEHGKGEPRPRVPYELKPLGEFTSSPQINELCRLLGSGQVDQRVAQAAAWHYSDNMSWEELSAKRIRHANGLTEPYFSPREIQAAMQLAALAEKAAAMREKPKTTENSDSLEER